VPTTGCFKFTGDHALAYVRSRHYQYLDPKTGKWVEDPAADLGRISRQQDFLRRIVAKALSTGVYTPSVARGLIDTGEKYVVTDPDLTLNRMLQFAGVIEHLDPSAMRSYQIEVTADTRAGSAVLIPRLGGANMKAILAVFRGRAPLVGAPAPGATAATDPAATTPITAVPIGGAVTSTTSAAVPTVVTTPSSSTPSSVAAQNVKGIVPPADVTC
ncbi:MAG TPA: hypothetical protein VGM78_12245, partial [Ilumatobacteraceae bacterium]